MGLTFPENITGDLQPTMFLGNFSTSDPLSNNGQWWYRTDLGIILRNVNGNIIPMTTGADLLIIDSNQTIGSTSSPTTVSQNVIVLNNATLTIEGTIYFQSNVTITKGASLLSSNTLASSTSPQTNNYYFIGNLYLGGTYQISQYNTDNIAYSTTINESNGNSGSITGLGTLSVASGLTLTVSNNLTLSVPTVSGAGTLSVSSGYTVNINGTLSISNIVVNGILLYIGPSITASTSNAQATFSPSISGTGMFIGANSSSGTGTKYFDLTAELVPANGFGSNSTGSGGTPYYSGLTIQGNTVGRYTIGVTDTSNTTYNGFILIYIGTINTNYYVSGEFASTTADISGDNMDVYNMTGSAGTIILSAWWYV